MKPGATNRWIILTGVFCVLALVSAPLLVAQDRGAFEKEYGVINERNIFLKERHKPRAPSTQGSRDWRGDRGEQGRESPEQTLVLRGIVIEDNELRAYFENTRTGVMQRAVPGDLMAGGRIQEIAIDAVSYEGGGRITWIEIGHNLTGARAAEVPRSYGSISSGSPVGTTASSATQPTGAGSSAGAAPAAGGAPVPGGEGLTIEEQMRRRRAQMQGGTPPSGGNPPSGGTPPATPIQEGPQP